MRPQLVLTSCATVFIGLILVATHISEDPQREIHVPHPAGPMLAITFAHADHTETNCTVCHHNFVDDTGQGMCLDCHNSDPELSPLMQTQFHDLCRNCHIEQQAADEPHGPTRSCHACHWPDQRP